MDLAKHLIEQQPRVLYKYASIKSEKRKADLVDTLLHDHLYCSSPITFNDPFELRPSFNPPIESEQFRKSFFEFGTRCAPHLFTGMYSTPEDLNRLLAQRYDQLVAEPSQVYGQLQRGAVCCLTEKENDLLMWAHYTDGHNGYCLKFEEPIWATTQRVVAYEVEYDDAYPSVDIWPAYYERLKPEAEQDARIYWEFTKGLALRKSPAWRYEREWRLLRPEPGVVNFNPDCLKQIIFGSRVSSEVISEIEAVIKRRAAKVTVSKAELSRGRFELEYVPLR